MIKLIEILFLTHFALSAIGPVVEIISHRNWEAEQIKADKKALLVALNRQDQLANDNKTVSRKQNTRQLNASPASDHNAQNPAQQQSGGRDNGVFERP